jgi:BirA family transcriptional regulator, biotin operon repressor / biotin---[acetyl-CoA-carboxylase] ligase
MPPSARRFGHPRFHYETIDTTMREAAQRAEAGAAEGTLVTADLQTEGRGRLGRRWESSAGGGLAFSLVLRPPESALRTAALTLACGLGVARGIARSVGVACDLRWPNDVLVGERKLAGVLVEASVEGGRTKSVVVGVGLNVNQPEFPPPLAAIATSLRIETGREHDREALLEAVLVALEDAYGLLLAGGPTAVVEAFSRASSYARGKVVAVEGGPVEWSGVTAGLDADGRLLVRVADGRVVPVVAGSVRRARTSA